MLTFTWDSTYESLPTSSLARSSVDDEVRRIKGGVRAIMEQEHEWGPYSEKNDGSHKGGSTQVALNGSQTERDALLDMQTGALYIRTDGAYPIVDCYSGSAWVQNQSSLSHDDLLDRNSGSPHPQYMLQDGVYEVELDANAFDLLASNSNVLRWSHVNSTSNPHGPITNPNAFQSGLVTYDMLSVTIVSGNIDEIACDRNSFAYRNAILQDAPHFIRTLKLSNDISEQSVVRLATNSSSSWGVGFSIFNDSINKEYHLEIDYSFYRLNL